MQHALSLELPSSNILIGANRLGEYHSSWLKLALRAGEKRVRERSRMGGGAAEKHPIALAHWHLELVGRSRAPVMRGGSEMLLAWRVGGTAAARSTQHV